MNDLKKTARMAGGWYLALALSGLFGFIMVRPAIYARAIRPRRQLTW